MLYSAFIIGLAGSLHCLGMCGPIALALPVPAGGQLTKVAGRALYNFGRITTYATLGLLIGLFGQSLSLALSQQKLSVSIGIIMLLLIVLPGKATHRLNAFAPVARFTGRVKRQFSGLFRKRSLSALFGLGLLNGLLPCGMIYVALAGAVATGSGVTGMAYMALFGLGTLPMMLSISLGVQWLNIQWRNKLLRVVPVFTVLLAFMLILRGLDLGIPGLSPHVEKTVSTVKMECCHKK
jgi:sulfite exporter TauE/SafE